MNDSPAEWLKAIEGMKDHDELPLKKRLLFVYVDEHVVAEEAVAAHEADLGAGSPQETSKIEDHTPADTAGASLRDDGARFAGPDAQSCNRGLAHR